MQFYKEEIALRRAMAYPPFSRMVTIHLSNLSKEKGEGRAKIIAVAAKSIAASFKGKEAVTVLGPALSPIPKMRGRYRWQLILKGASTNTLHRTAKEILSLGSREGLRIRVDVDPVNFM
jgi:primosomal protein N' (replication factor Y)